MDGNNCYNEHIRQCLEGYYKGSEGEIFNRFTAERPMMAQPPKMPEQYPPPYMMPYMSGQFQQPPGSAPYSASTSSCSCSNCESTTSSSSRSSSSSSSSSNEETGIDSVEVSTPLKGPNYNYEFCTCEVPLPATYIPPPLKKKKPRFKGPKAGIWCGSPSCAVAKYFPASTKGVILNPLPLKLKGTSAAVAPGTCCFRNDQFIFQVPERGKKNGDGGILPFYNVGPDEQPLGVKMIKPEENPQLDPDNNTYLLTITKTDDQGKPAKLQLALKIPRPPDLSVSGTDRQVQYDTEDLNKRPTGRKSRKSKGGRKKSSRAVSWSKRTSKRKTSRKTTLRKSTKASKASTVKFGGLKTLRKEMKKVS